MTDQEPKRLETLSAQRVISGDGMPTLVTAMPDAVLVFLKPTIAEVLAPWENTEGGKELAKIKTEFDLNDKRREIGLALLKGNIERDDYRYNQISDALASNIYPNPNTLTTRKLTVSQVRERLRRAAWLSRESLIHDIARREQDPTFKDETLENLLAEIDSLPEYAGIHDENGHLHRGRLIRILRRQVPFSEVGNPITDADKFSIRYGTVISSKVVECTPCGDGADPVGYGIKVDQGHTPPKRGTIPFPKTPERQTLTTHEEWIYSMMLIDPGFCDYIYPDVEILFGHKDRSLREGIKLPQSEYDRRFNYFKKSISTFAGLLRQYDKNATVTTLTQLKLERFFHWAEQQPLYARYTPTELADILERQKSVRDIMNDYKKFLLFGVRTDEAAS